jgi:hypothetical protein
MDNLYFFFFFFFLFLLGRGAVENEQLYSLPVEPHIPLSSTPTQAAHSQPASKPLNNTIPEDISEGKFGS